MLDGRFIYEGNLLDQVNGNLIWKMLSEKEFEGLRSWQSLRGRWTKTLKNRPRYLLG